MDEWFDFEDASCDVKGECEEDRAIVIQSSGVNYMPGIYGPSSPVKQLFHWHAGINPELVRVPGF
jgi:hypothetical protein